MEKPVRFYSETVPMAGVLFMPEGMAANEKRPGIVMCHGFTAVKEVLLPEIARRMATLGYVTLTFDYRFLGASGGEPRGDRSSRCGSSKIFVMPSRFYRTSMK